MGGHVCLFVGKISLLVSWGMHMGGWEVVVMWIKDIHEGRTRDTGDLGVSIGVWDSITHCKS